MHFGQNSSYNLDKSAVIDVSDIELNDNLLTASQFLELARGAGGGAVIDLSQTFLERFSQSGIMLLRFGLVADKLRKKLDIVVEQVEFHSYSENKIYISPLIICFNHVQTGFNNGDMCVSSSESTTSVSGVALATNSLIAFDKIFFNVINVKDAGGEVCWFVLH